MSKSSHRTALDSALAALSGVNANKHGRLIRSSLELQKRQMIQEDTLKAERARRDRETKRRIKSTLFTKSRELFHLEQLCRSVAGTLGAATSWKKFFVGDPDFVLASTVKKVQRRDAKKRAVDILSSRRDIDNLEYSHFPPPDAVRGAPVTKYQKQEAIQGKRKARAGVVIDDLVPAPLVIDLANAETQSDPDTSSDDVVPAAPNAVARRRRRPAAGAVAAVIDPVEQKKLKRGRRRWATGYGALGDMSKHNEADGVAGRNRLGQSLPMDEKWPAWDTPDPEVPTNADYFSLQDDSKYFQQFGAYMSDVMLAAMRETVSEIRVLDTMAGHGKRIPIQRLVCEALVSTMFAKWIASVILKNRYLSCGTWPKDIIITNLGYQLDVCRAFFMDPDKFSGSADIYKPLPAAAVGDDAYYYDDDDDDDDVDDDGDVG